MKQILTLTLCVLFIYSAQAQTFSCFNSGPSACTPSGVVTQPGLSPPSSQIAPIVNGAPINYALQFLNYDTVIYDGDTIDTRLLQIISMSNLPSGLCWKTNDPLNQFTKLERGCVVLSGTPCDLPGQYLVTVLAAVTDSTLMFPNFYNQYTVELTFMLRVINNGGATIPVNNAQTAAFSPYGGSPSCALPPNYLRVYFESGDTACKGYDINVHVVTNIPFDTANDFYLSFDASGFSCTERLTNYVHANTSGIYTFRVPTDVGGIFNTCNVRPEVTFKSTNPVRSQYVADVVFMDGPSYGLLLNDYRLCDPFPLVLNYSLSPPPGQTYVWNELPSGTFISNNISIPVNPLVTTQYQLIASTGWGCVQQRTVTVTVTPKPTSHVTVDYEALCQGDNVILGGTPAGSYLYRWTAAGGYTSSAVNPNITPSQTTTYYVKVMATGDTTCFVRDTVVVNVKQPTLQQLCMVTVDSSSSYNVIVWEKTDREGTDSFYVYREITTNNYQKIGAVHRDSLSEYYDYTSNPNATSYRYKVSANDTCNHEGALSTYHNSVHLQYLGNGNLQWNTYLIENGSTPVASFDVYRDANGNGNWLLLISVSGTQTTATDPAFNAVPNARYRVQANWSTTCTPSRSTYGAVNSNIIYLNPNAIADVRENNIQVYPNPFSDQLNIQSSDRIESLKLFDLTGRLVYQSDKVENNTRLNLSELRAGVYTLTIKTATGLSQRKLVRSN